MSLLRAAAPLLVFLACRGPEGPAGPAGAGAPWAALSPAAVELLPGATARLVVTVAPEGDGVTLSTTNPDIATVDETGLVTAHREGSTFVTAAAASGATAYAGVLVKGSRRYAEVSYARDIEPLFRTADLWFPGAKSCDSCHFSGNDNSAAEMELASYAGLMAGSWGFTAPSLARSVLGESSRYAKDFDWERSVLRRRLTEARMPPDGPFSLQALGRDGPQVALDGGGAAPALDVLGAWVGAGAPEHAAFDVPDAGAATFAGDVLPLFVTPNLWYPGAASCDFCHFQSTPRASAELRLRDWAGIMAGARSRTAPPGFSILGETAPGARDFDWAGSILRQRLRDTQMPPGRPWDRNGNFASGPWRTHPVTGEPVRAVDLIKEWVNRGAKNN